MHPNDGYDVDTGCKSSCNYPNAAPAPIRECAMNVCFNYVCHGLRQMRAKPAWYVFLFVLFCGKLGHLPGRRTRVKRMFVPWNNTSGGACFWSAPKKESCVCHGSARIRANTMFHGLVGGKFIKVLLQKSTLFTYVEIYSKSYSCLWLWSKHLKSFLTSNNLPLAIARALKLHNLNPFHC